jgi:hypothetical protein
MSTETARAYREAHGERLNRTKRDKKATERHTETEMRQNIWMASASRAWIFCQSHGMHRVVRVTPDNLFLLCGCSKPTRQDEKNSVWTKKENPDAP